MSCGSRIELSVCQIVCLVTLTLISAILAAFGWFRTIEPVEYGRATTTTLNNVTSFFHGHRHARPYLDDIGSPPILNNPESYIQFTFLQMNDVYELIPMSGGKKGGLARVATIRKLLLQENRHTFTIMAGDMVSPSALGNSIVNGSALNGKQMIATLNVLGLDFATLGNHEFDLKEPSLRRRLNESRFEWIASNVYELDSDKPFHNILPFKIVTIANVKILLIGLTIDDNLGPNPKAPYVNITSQKTLPQFTSQYIKYLRNDLNLNWDILICLTHLNMHNDIEVVEQNPQIDVVMGGHEHENYYLKRGSKLTPIYKADDNAATVFIHRFAYQPETKQLLIFSKLTRVSPRFLDEPETAKVANYFYQVGLQGYREKGYIPERIICMLPNGMSFDGRSAVIRAQQSHLTQALCRSMMDITGASICVFNSGAIRIDDQLMDIITEYDVLRCLPFAADVILVKTSSNLLTKVLNRGLKDINTGMFPSYEGLEYDSIKNEWKISSTGQLLDEEDSILDVVTIPYFQMNTQFKEITDITYTNVSLTRAFIEYLQRTYELPKRKRLI